MRRTILRIIISLVVAVVIEIVLYNVYSYINVMNGQRPLSFSIARVVALMVIYWGTHLLMVLQRNPDYELSKGAASETK